MTETSIDFLVRRDDFADCRFREAPVPPLAEGQVLFAVDRFALTSNNVTYAVAGDMLDYWGFFPSGEDGMGRIPAMGFGDVIASRHPGVREGLRAFGFFPMSSRLLVEPDGVSETGFVDGVAHRAGHAAAYRQYRSASNHPLHAGPESEDAFMLLSGLFTTSFLVDDFLAEHDGFGADCVIVTSASSKTSIALAHCLARRGGARVIGLTSAANQEFVRKLGLYDEIVRYDAADSLPSEGRAVLVDMAGNAAVRRTVHERFGEGLVHSCIIGATHWDQGGDAGPLPGAAPTLFFAPSQITKRYEEWGAAVYQQRLADAWRGFLAGSEAWLRVERGAGPQAVERVYRDLLGGRSRPEVGHVLSLGAEE